MADRLYYVIPQDRDRQPLYVIFDFEARQVRRVVENPHPDGSNLLPPFYVNEETFWGIVNRIRSLDEQYHRNFPR